MLGGDLGSRQTVDEDLHTRRLGDVPLCDEFMVQQGDVVRRGEPADLWRGAIELQGEVLVTPVLCEVEQLDLHLILSIEQL